MADTSQSHISIAKLIFIPSLITLAITVLRVVGELQHWPRALFNPDAGGGGSIIGITWLALVFGVYFALRLARAGETPPGAGRVIGYALLGLVITAGGGFLGFGLRAEFPGKILIGLVLIAIGALIPFRGWKELAKVLLAYGYAARIPVVILMYFAMRGNWHTHYDAIPPGFPEDVSFWMKYIQLAVVPQLLMWIAFTTVMGSLFGGIALALTRRGKAQAPQPA
ncbi:MAG: hypothetical protein DMF60_21495 [Acidobacteria bacterium]|nr:MAG: hypothetical protein DMF60_21495 [Acidobacteriota bacterium]